MTRGTRPLRRRYRVSSLELMAFAMRLYRAALAPLKLTLRDNAIGLFAEKCLMHNT